MVGATSNVYVSVTKGYEQDEDPNDHHYRRQQHSWLISIEPHKHHIPFLPHNKLEPTHYKAPRLADGDRYTISLHTTENIIGTILVAEGTHGSAEHLRQILEEGLGSPPTSAVPSEQVPEESSDRWVRRALHVLQAHKVTEAFDVVRLSGCLFVRTPTDRTVCNGQGEFMTFATAYLQSRLEHEAHPMVPYPKLHPTKEAKKQGFWLSYPTSTPKSNDPESRLYGGLM